jgi:hypothetical protein
MPDAQAEVYVDVMSDGEMLCLTDVGHRTRQIASFDLMPQALAKLDVTPYGLRKDPKELVVRLEKALAPALAARGDSLAGKLIILGGNRLLCVLPMETLQDIGQFLGESTSGYGDKSKRY